MSDYRDMVQEEAKAFYEEVRPDYEKDKEEHGGASDRPNLAKWLDRTRRLLDRLDKTSKSWGRSEAAMITQSSRNGVTYGDPKESAYFAFHKDVLAELKKLRKSGG